MSRPRLVVLALGLALSAAAVYLLLRAIDISAALRALRSASPAWLVLGILMTQLGYYLRTHRWQGILSPQAKPRFSRLFSAMMVGFLAINILPARLGELVRAYVLSRTERIPAATVLGSVAVERILDFGMLAVFWALSLLFAPLPGWFRWSGYLTVLASVAVALVLWALHAARGRSAPWGEAAFLSWLPGPLRRASSSIIPAFGAGLEILGRPALLAAAAGWSIAVWCVSGAVFLLVGESLGIGLPFWSAFLLSFVVCVGISVPSSPGFIGLMEGACVIGLAIFGVDGADGLAFGILYHVTQIVPPLLLGTFFMVREHLTPELLQSAEIGEGQGGRKE